MHPQAPAGRRDGHHEQVQALFDAKAAGWSGKYTPAGRLAGRLARLDAVVRARVDAGGELLDLGCGSGDLARHLAAGGYQVTGCDISSQMLSEAAAADGGRAVRWIQLDPGWRTLPLETASLDAVVASSVLEYVREPSAVLRECARVLRPGGIVLCTVPDVTHPVRWLEWPLVWAAQAPGVPAAARMSPRLQSYAAYLRISRQRRRMHWWYATGWQAGLRPAPSRRGPRAPLRLLTFTRPQAVASQPGDARDNDR